MYVRTMQCRPKPISRHMHTYALHTDTHTHVHSASQLLLGVKSHSQREVHQCIQLVSPVSAMETIRSVGANCGGSSTAHQCNRGHTCYRWIASGESQALPGASTDQTSLWLVSCLCTEGNTCVRTYVCTYVGAANMPISSNGTYVRVHSHMGRVWKWCEACTVHHAAH